MHVCCVYFNKLNWIELIICEELRCIVRRMELSAAGRAVCGLSPVSDVDVRPISFQRCLYTVTVHRRTVGTRHWNACHGRLACCRTSPQYSILVFLSLISDPLCSLLFQCCIYVCYVLIKWVGWSAWLSSRTSVSGQRSFAVLRSTCSW